MGQEDTVMRDQTLMRDHFYSNMARHFYAFVLLMKDHLSYKSIFCGPVVWSLITGFTYLNWNNKWINVNMDSNNQVGKE